MVAISLSGLMQSAFPPFGMWRNTGREASFREWMLPICRVVPSPPWLIGKEPKGRAELFGNLPPIRNPEFDLLRSDFSGTEGMTLGCDEDFSTPFLEHGES